MNDLLKLLEDPVNAFVTASVIITAALCALILNDAWANRKQLQEMRQEDERLRQRSKYLRENARKEREAWVREDNAIKAIESLKRRPEMNDIDALKKAGWM